MKIPYSVFVLLAALSGRMALAASHDIDEHRSADPKGQVEIVNVGGQVDVIGWDKPEIEVAGTLGSDTDKLDITSAGNRTSIRVVDSDSDSGEQHWRIRVRGGRRDATLSVHVPRGSSLSASLVSANLSVRDLQGNQELQTVSGNVTAAAAHDVRIHTINGDIHLSAGPESRLLELGTVSGDLDVEGGRGDININTVSGEGKLALGAITHASIKSVSGNYQIRAALAGDGLLEGQSVSGDFTIDFTGAPPAADFELHTFSGDLKSCFGQKAAHENYGPGSRLSFRQGAGGAQVRIDTHSGDVSVCAQGS
jgi:Putative adhesin